MFRMFMSIVWLGGITALASAQTPGSTYDQLQETYAAAEAAAVRPGDENLDCDALATELVAVAKDSAVQAYIVKAGAAAQKQYDAMNAAAAAMAAQSAFSLFSSIVPGGGWAGHSAAVAQAEAQKLQAARNIQERMQQAQEMMSIMPQMMRGNRVIQLAQARDCVWLREAMGDQR
jgi:hypothetical protein